MNNATHRNRSSTYFSVFIIQLLIYDVVLQNIVVNFLAQGGIIPRFILQGIIVSKDLILLFLFLYLLIRGKRVKYNLLDKLLLLNLVISAAFLFISEVPWKVPFFARLSDLRLFVIVFLLYSVGRLLSKSVPVETFMRMKGPNSLF